MSIVVCPGTPPFSLSSGAEKSVGIWKANKGNGVLVCYRRHVKYSDFNDWVL